jgi:putative ABC transport system substrate-binding protein
MKRRQLAGFLVAGLVPGTSLAQTAAPRRVGVLIDGSAPHLLPAALQRDLAALGFTDGREVVFDVRYADGKRDRANELAAELVRGGTDIIVAHFTPAVRAAMEATRTIPIIMAPAGAPVETGLVASLSKPGGNVTGVTNMAAELGGRRLQLLKDMLPTLDCVAVLASTQDPFTKPFLSYMQDAAKGGGLRLEPVMAEGPADFERAFAAMVAAGAGAVVIQGVFNTQRARILDLVAQHRLPTMWFDRQAVLAGGLVSLSANTADIYKRAASMTAKVLKGAKAADLPVEQPAIFELVVNLQAARAMKLSVPQAVLTQADEILE